MPTDEIPTVRRGWKTTEFWLSAVALAAGFFTLITGVDVSGPAEVAVRAIGGAVSAVVAVGYLISRALTKRAALQGNQVRGQV